MKAVVYILKSGNGRFYVGSTNDLPRRLEQHRRGHTHTTHRTKDNVLVFQQEFESLEVARKIERKLKSWHRKDFLEKIIRDGRIISVD